jgi:hypothetical protein
VVVREDFSMDLARALRDDTVTALNHLDELKPGGHFDELQPLRTDCSPRLLVDRDFTAFRDLFAVSSR